MRRLGGGLAASFTAKTTLGYVRTLGFFFSTQIEIFQS